MKKGDTTTSIRALLALLIVFLGFGVVALFKTYYQNILASGNLNVFLTLVFVGMGLLITLLFLSNPTAKAKKGKQRHS